MTCIGQISSALAIISARGNHFPSGVVQLDLPASIGSSSVPGH
ncbi:MAG TPA: hypothetical protein VN380_21245 [Thermoanaerobaculia bacterium]|nr:hypothetical protein [Thermoanaerobaculia bacterium]